MTSTGNETNPTGTTNPKGGPQSGLPVSVELNVKKMLRGRPSVKIWLKKIFVFNKKIVLYYDCPKDGAQFYKEV